jgi:flagellar motor switch protein FliN/FliY
MSDENLSAQNDIERLLSQANQGPASAVPKPPAAAAFSPAAPDPNQLEAPLPEGGGRAPTHAAESGRGESSSPAKTAPAQVADDAKLLAQDDLERLLGGAGKAPPAAASAPAAAQQTAEGLFPSEGTMAASDMEYLLNQAEQALASINTSVAGEIPQGVAPFRLEEFTGAPASTETATLDLIRDVELDLKIELGRTHMYLEDVLRLRKGSVVPLDKLAGDPVDIYVNGRLIARGEVLVLNDNFCVRVAELIAGTNVFA